MKKILLIACIILITITAVQSWYIFIPHNQKQTNQITPRPLLVYTFENLKKTTFPATQITLGPVTSETQDSFSQIFYFSVPKTPGSNIMLRVSGLMNIPKNAGEHPVIVMFRGFIPDASFVPGAGTQPSARVFAKNA